MKCPTRRQSRPSLDSLASFELLGLRSEGARLRGRAWPRSSAWKAARIIPSINEYPRIVELGARLRQNHDIEGILEKDLEVFHSLATAFKAANALIPVRRHGRVRARRRWL